MSYVLIPQRMAVMLTRHTRNMSLQLVRSFQSRKKIREKKSPLKTPFSALIQAFRFMVSPGHCPMLSKYSPSLPKAVDPSILGVKKSHFNKKYSSNRVYDSTKQKVHVGCQYSKTCQKQPLKKDKDLNNKW